MRKDREQQIEAIKLIQHPPALERAQEHLAYLEEQIAVEEIKLAECQKTCGLNWLAGKYMVVDVIEHDEGFLPTDIDCHKEELLTSTTVSADGSFTATFSTDDPCKHDKLSHAAIELRVRLRFCDSSYCFSINASKNEPYTLSHPRLGGEPYDGQGWRRYHNVYTKLQHRSEPGRAEQLLDCG